MKGRSFVLGVVAGATVASAVVSCSRESARPSSPPEASTDAASAAALPSSVGEARMLPDGTLELDLRGPGGAEARIAYPPSHPKYNATLEHLGGMKPGETKSVPPWPDPWDAARVEAAAHAHAAKKGWARDEYKVEITGTDAEGNAAVTLHHAIEVRPQAGRQPEGRMIDVRAKGSGGGKSVAIRIETRGYTVVRELAFQ